MSQPTRKSINKRLINLERKLRKLEKAVGIKTQPWTINVNPRNTGANTKSTELTNLMIRFCEEYPKDLNGTQAAIRAGYSENGAGVVASNLLKDDRIRLKIEELNKGRLRRLNITVNNVLKEIALMAFSNIADVCTWRKSGIKLKSSSRLSREETAAIKSITETVTPKTVKLAVTMHDKPSALVLLCRYLNVLDGNADVVDADDTAKKFKAAYNEMFNSVPTEPPEGEETAEPIEEEPTQEDVDGNDVLMEE